ncbi:MAG TPA: hypothetical protein PLR06_12885 [Cyclobacteriaceae bacterium]|nr:hypothetical protein [Cyclobacteriaceae bacterium]
MYNRKHSLFAFILLLISSACFSQANTFLKKYAGSYHMLTDGTVANSKTDKYVFTPDGKCTWTMFTTVNPDGSVSNIPVKKSGTWKASEGLIQMHFVMGDGEGEELISDFQLTNGVFRAGNIYLKKILAAKAEVKK